MKPFIDDAGRICASPEDARFLLTEAKRSGQAQISAYGVTTSWRTHWTNRLTMIDGLLAQLPDDAVVEAPLLPEDDGICDHAGCEADATEDDLTTGRKTCPLHHGCLIPPVINDTDLDDLLG